MDPIIRFVAQYFFLISIAVVALYWLRARRSVKVSLAWHLVAGGVIALALARIAGKLYYDPRPFVTHHLVPLIAHAADNGFPSDHALLTSFLAFTMYLYSKRITIFLVINALLVSWARVGAHLHNPRDIVGSFIFSAVAVVAVEVISRIYQSRRAARSH